MTQPPELPQEPWTPTAQPVVPQSPAIPYQDASLNGSIGTESYAIASLVCGIVAFAACGVVLGPLGIIFGVMARRRIAASSGRLAGDGMALAGIICGSIALALNVIFLAVYVVFIVAFLNSSANSLRLLG